MQPPPLLLLFLLLFLLLLLLLLLSAAASRLQVTLEDRWGMLMSLEMCVVALSAYLIARTSRFGTPTPPIGQAL